ncbi:MAG: acyl CoA:acetate/3-ketoacid CoA transferase, partial [Comamonadaceae bacterium]|nr:acyl CoA:acetate/3-ketoacid CoA transferase [Comamonadaceae bacterium]
MKVITADEAGALIPDDATIFLGGLAVTSLPEEVLQGVERTFLSSGHPRNVTTWACG